MSGRVGSVTYESGMVENVAVAAKTALPASFRLKVISTSGSCGRHFGFPMSVDGIQGKHIFNKCVFVCVLFTEQSIDVWSLLVIVIESLAKIKDQLTCRARPLPCPAERIYQMRLMDL